ncbi:putative hydrolase [Bacillus sp. TS-2]|nr:putative hydrolase [Bacillus sp. TS-2]
MKRKIVFLDVDGTLMQENGQVPASAITACREARKNGHLLFLCTGRSKAAIFKNITEIGFDGVIGGAGVYAEINGDVLYKKTLTLEEVTFLVDYFQERDIHFMMESDDINYGSPGLKDFYIKAIQSDSNASDEFLNKDDHPLQQLMNITKFDETLYQANINKICFIGSENTSYQEIEKDLKERLNIVPSSFVKFGKASGEVSSLGVHKAVGIKFILEHLGLSQEDTIGIGDSLNDLEMIEYCAVGIAMGNARTELKTIADEITAPIDEDGIYKSFKKHHLI